MKNKKMWLGVIAIVVCIVVAMVVVKPQRNSKPGKREEKEATNVQNETTLSADEITEIMEETTTERQNKTEKKDTTETGKSNKEEKEKDSEKTDGTTEQSITTEQTATTEQSTEEVEKKISFPYQIADQEVEIKSLSGYDGIYVEDGSDEELTNVTTILVKNKSNKVIEYGTITLQAEDETLEFSFSTLPAGKSCIVMEKNKTTYNKKWKLQYVTSNFAYADELSKLESEISLKTEKNNGITIKNKTDSTIPRIRIFYKYKLDSGEYVGGITYTCSVDDLEGQESRTIYPSHFSTKGSVIMMARRYEEKSN